MSLRHFCGDDRLACRKVFVQFQRTHVVRKAPWEIWVQTTVHSLHVRRYFIVGLPAEHVHISEALQILYASQWACWADQHKGPSRPALCEKSNKLQIDPVVNMPDESKTRPPDRGDVFR